MQKKQKITPLRSYGATAGQAAAECHPACRNTPIGVGALVYNL